MHSQALQRAHRGWRKKKAGGCILTAGARILENLKITHSILIYTLSLSQTIPQRVACESHVGVSSESDFLGSK